MQWIDLSPYGMKLLVVDLPTQEGGRASRVLVMANGDRHAEGVSRLGFRKHPASGAWILTGATPSFAAIEAEFPNARRLPDADPKDFYRRIGARPQAAATPATPAPAPEPTPAAPGAARPAPADAGPKQAGPKQAGKEGAPVEVLLAQSRFLGLNRLGHEVYENLRGRFMQDGRGKIVFETEMQGVGPGLFLRAPDEASLAVAAEGFVEEIAKGKILRFEDLRRFASAVFGAEIDAADPRLLRAHMAIEGALARWLARKGGTCMRDIYGGAVKLHEGHPYLGDLLRHQKGAAAMPQPVSVAVQRALGTDADLNGRNVVVTGAGAGTLFAHLPRGAQVKVFESDRVRAVHARATMSAAGRAADGVVEGTADYAGADMVVANLERRLLDRPRSFEGLAVGRADLAEMLDSLEARAPQGRSVFVLRCGDSAEEREEMERVRAFVGARYAIEGTVDLDGGMHSGRAEAAPMRILVVGRRRPAQLADAPEPAMRLREVRDFNGLWAWTAEVVANRAKIADHYALDADAAAGADDGNVDPDLIENSFQAPYVAMSGVGQASTMVPRNLEGATREALARVARKHEDVDQWVANELAMTREQLEDRFSPEQVDAIALAIDAEERGRAFLNADQTGIGKGRSQPLDAKILTPHGWITMGEIRVGDRVIAVDGTATEIIGVYPQGEIDIFEVTFSDGAKTRSSADHLWATLTRNQRHQRKRNPDSIYAEYKIRTTEEIARTITRIHSIPLPSPVQFTERAVLVDPYLMGALLGDACIRRSSIELVMADSQMVEAVSARLPDGMVAHKRAQRTYHYSIVHRDGRRAKREFQGISNPVTAGMRHYGLAGVCASDKFLPDDYKFNSVDVRLAALRGLMDTDGTAAKHGSSVFSSASKRLAEDVQFLVRSLGGLASITPKKTRKKLSYSVFVTLPGASVFGLARKAERASRLSGRCQERYIKSVVHVGKAQAQCIAIAHPTRLYVTDDFVVTHNTLAALMRRAAMQGKKVLFLTEREINISDIWRDIVHTRSEGEFAPLILNDGAAVIDEATGDTVMRAPKRDAVQRIMETRAWPEEHNLMLATYSQFNKPGVPPERPRGRAAQQEVAVSAKSAWLREAVDGDTLVVLDECHNVASGTSNASANVAAAAARAGGIVFSSATFAKNAKNMGIYAPLFPGDFDTENLTEVMRRGGETLQETLSAMLVKDGVMIRREHDLSKCEFTVVPDEANAERNRRLMDALAPILAEMAYLSGDLDRRVNAMNDAVERQLRQRLGDNDRAVRQRMKSLQVNRVGFGSPLYNLSRLFICSLLIDKAADSAIAALRGNKKPVILVENTIQSVLEELAGVQDEVEGSAAPDFKDLMRRAVGQLTRVTRAGRDGREVVDLARPDPEIEAAESLIERMVEALPDAMLRADEPGVEGDPGFKEAMGRTLDLVAADLRGGAEDADVEAFAQALERVRRMIGALPDAPAEAAPAIRRMAATLPDTPARAVRRIRAMIDGLPDLPASAIDEVRDRIEAAGFTCEEITGRGWECREGRILRRPAVSKTEVKNRFNSGATDAVIINTAGATGIDLHAGRRFLDQRQRVMIELQAPADITRQIQAYGRVNRFDQVIGPEIWSLMAGLPIEFRLMAMRNAKLRRMSANTTSNRDNSALIKDIPDLINAVGDIVCSRYADARPDLMRRLGFDVDRNARIEARNAEAADGMGEDQKDNQRSANEFLARLAMLPVAQQEQTMTELDAEYRATLEELDARGENPLKSRTIDGIVHPRERAVFEGADVENPTSEFHRPVFAQRVIVERTVEPLRSEQVATEFEKGLVALGAEGPDVQADRLARRREALLSVYLPRDAANVQDALAQGHPVLTEMNRRLDALIDVLGRIRPGSEIALTLDGVVEQGVVTRILMPRRGYEHLASAYDAEFILPGDAMPRRASLSSLLRDEGFALSDGLNGEEYDAILARYDRALEGSRLEARTLLVGNDWLAMNLSIQHKLGSMVAWEDEKGIRHRGVLVSKRHHNLDFLPVSMRNARMAASALLEGGAEIYGTSELSSTGIAVKPLRDGRFVFHMPNPRSRKHGFIYEHPPVQALLQRLNAGDDGRNPRLIVERDVVEIVLGHLVDAGARFYASSRHRAWANAWMAENYAEDEAAANDPTEAPRAAVA